ncbi:hypothetical protein E2C01_027678 [Portunus trituberculatus]|uniref:Uncharacterized protein n=1 Tax=Portunus trituberculatus TaxID=210409 RepID=A0A5B7ELI6_PORTR|nr:hypothetical protein [Portunus trituberculatus]
MAGLLHVVRRQSYGGEQVTPTHRGENSNVVNRRSFEVQRSVDGDEALVGESDAKDAIPVCRVSPSVAWDDTVVHLPVHTCRMGKVGTTKGGHEVIPESRSSAWTSLKMVVPTGVICGEAGGREGPLAGSTHEGLPRVGLAASCSFPNSMFLCTLPAPAPHLPPLAAPLPFHTLTSGTVTA